MSIKLVIFDFDGVLVDSHDAWYESWKKAFESVGKELSLKDFDKYCWGSTYPIVSKKLGFTDEEFRSGGKVLLDSFKANIPKIKTFSGAIDTVASVGSKGLKRALVSNNRKDILEQVASQFGLEFDFIVDISKVKPKPDPEGIELIIKEMKVKKDEAIFIGDTDFDEQTGKNAGIKTHIIGKDIEKVADILKLI